MQQGQITIENVLNASMPLFDLEYPVQKLLTLNLIMQGSSNSASNKDMMSKAWTNGDTIV